MKKLLELIKAIDQVELLWIDSQLNSLKKWKNKSLRNETKNK